MEAAFIQMARDRLRATAAPLTPGCEHDLEMLPIVDFRLDYVCRRCAGFESRMPSAAS